MPKLIAHHLTPSEFHHVKHGGGLGGAHEHAHIAAANIDPRIYYEKGSFLQLRSSCDDSKSSARSQKWVKMEANWRIYASQRTKKVSRRVRKGIPPAHRRLVWTRLAKVEFFQQTYSGLYAELSSKEGGDWKNQIELVMFFSCVCVPSQNRTAAVIVGTE